MDTIDQSSPMKFYVLCKNEAPNIKKCLESLLAAGAEVIVYDSGSTDGTLDIVQAYPVTLVHYHYRTHCDAYNEIITAEDAPYCGILDADMEVSAELVQEILQTLQKVDVAVCPLVMYVDGFKVEKGSLLPPKTIGFRTGKPLFESVGHGERLMAGISSAITKNTVPHNDLKPYAAYLATQARYAENFINRASEQQLTWRDKLRLKTPLLIFITPLYSLIVKGGIFSRVGWLYAIDRLIAEAVMFRRSILKKIITNDKKGD